MAVAPIFPVLLVAVITRCKCEATGEYSSENGASRFGELLKPPPPPPQSPIKPVPFHGGTGRLQRQNADLGYRYQPPPPTPPPPLPSNDFKFPAPFYKQYNFNFVPPPQPFGTTPSPSLYQKVSGWLFNSQQTNHDVSSPIFSNNVATVKKDCNPCNLVPWIPVIRYNLGAKNGFQSPKPTYGPPSPTAYPNMLNIPQPFLNTQMNPPQLVPGAPHAVYGPPSQFQISTSIGIASSTYGPPSPTHTISIPSPNPLSSTYSATSTSYSAPSSSYSAPSSSYSAPSSSYYAPSSSYSAPSSSYSAPSSSYSAPSSSYSAPSSSYSAASNSYSAPSSSYSVPSSTYRSPSPTYGLPSISSSSDGISSSSYSESSPFKVPSSTYGPPTSTYTTSPSTYGSPQIPTIYGPVTPHYAPELLNSELQRTKNAESEKNIEPLNELQLPKVMRPTVFKNSYGETISNPHILDIPYPVSATAAESTKIKTEVLPNDNTRYPIPNATLALSNPAPFTLNRGRNIHTLQPVALPNLSVSPLPPIFNARPFRTSSKFPSNVVQGINSMQQNSHNVDISPSVPIAEFTHSIDYPATVVQSPIIDIDTPNNINLTKAYRNLPNSFVVDEVRDISSQASEDHVLATKSIPDTSFESTGVDGGNDLYENGVPTDFKPIHVPSNHRPDFADLRGVKDEDVDKYRTENNLQNIDSPLLYLKPSAPHKDFGRFSGVVTTPINNHDYEIYDDTIHTTTLQSTFSSGWDESQTDFNRGLSPPAVTQENSNKPKIVQIIVPYTTSKEGEETNNINFKHIPQDWNPKEEDEYQARKIPINTENLHSMTENYNTVSTTTEEPVPTTFTENYDSDRLNEAAILNDLYDVKEPPFDIIKLQHTIDDWTEQEYSKLYKTPQRSRGVEKYAKQIPDDFFTTTTPSNYVSSTNNYNYDLYDYEGSSSIQHTVTEENQSTIRPRKQYNIIERTKSKHNSAKNEEPDDVQKLHIYTAASTFRSTTTTPAPWGKIQTSISPLTKEKVYVVTSKPWLGAPNITNEWFDPDAFEFKKINADNDVSASDNFPFKSPRFSNRPPLGFTSAAGKADLVKPDSAHGFSKSWYQSINDLENREQRSNASLPEGFQQTHYTNEDEDTTGTTTVERHREDHV